MEVIHPYDIGKSPEKWGWAIGYLGMRGFDIHSFVYKTPEDDRVKKQIDCLTKWAYGSRNWLVCLCESPSYMRTLFAYVMSSYVFTTGNRAIMCDVDDLLEAVEDLQGDKRDIIEHADLLLISYADPSNQHLKWRKGSIANILQRRKFRRLSTFMDIFVPSIPKSIDEVERFNLSKAIVDSFGESVFELFTGDSAKNVVVRHMKENKKNAS